MTGADSWGFTVGVWVSVAITLFIMCSCLSFFSVRRLNKREALERAAADAAPHNSHESSTNIPPPPWQSPPHANGMPPHPNPNIQSSSVPHPYHAFRPTPYHAYPLSPNWTGSAPYNNQAVPHFTIAQPPRIVHTHPLYHSSSNASSTTPNHHLTHTPMQHNDRLDAEDLLSFEAPEKEKQNPCPICLGPLEDEQVSTGQCLHLIHTSCLKGWLVKDAKSACPVCRVPYQDAATGAISDQTNDSASTPVLTDVVMRT